MSAAAIPSADDIYRSLNPDTAGAPPATASPTPTPAGAATPVPAGSIPDADTIFRALPPPPDTPANTPDKPKTAPPPSWHDFLVNQLPGSLKMTAANIGQALTDPNTADNVVDVLKGGMRALYRKTGLDLPEDQSDRAAQAAAEFYKNRYWGWDRIKHTAYTDPAGAALDASTALTGAGEVLGTAADVANAAKFGEAARTLGTAGKVAGVTGDVFNPLTWGPKAVGWVANKLGPGEAATAATAAATPEELAAQKAAADQARQEAINRRAYEISGQRQGAGTMPGYDDWTKAIQDVDNQAAKAPPAATPSAAKPLNPIVRKITNTLSTAGLGVGVAELIAHQMYGAIGAGLSSGALHFLPMFLETAEGQRVVAGIGRGANIADKTAQFVPALNAAYAQYRQQQKQQPIDLSSSPFFNKAKGGAVTPEPLARLQRERFRGPTLAALRK